MTFTTAGVIAAIGAAAAAGGTALSYNAAQDSRKLGARSAEQERLATEERIRRLGLEMEAVIGAQSAGAAAGGVDIQSGSVRLLRQEAINEFQRQIQFTARAGAFAASSAEIQGRNAAYQNLSASLSSLANAVRLTNEAGQDFGLWGTQQ